MVEPKTKWCTDRVMSHPLPRQCPERGVNARIADKLVWEHLMKLITSPELLQTQITRWMNKRNITNLKPMVSLDELEQQLKKIKREESQYVKLFGSELIDQDQLESVMKELKQKKAEVEQKMRDVVTNKPEGMMVAPSDKAVRDFADRVKSYTQSCEFVQRRGIIERYIDEIVATQAIIRVRGYVPIEKEQEYVNFKTVCRNCGFAQCGEVDAV